MLEENKALCVGASEEWTREALTELEGSSSLRPGARCGFQTTQRDKEGLCGL